MRHWTRKHDLASYVNYTKRSQPLSYRYGPTTGLGQRTDFIRLLRAVHGGAVFYDPGLNIKNAFEGAARVKKRSQFRTSFSALDSLYATFDIVNLSAE
jgi:MvaI/BcnI restriction endonuclease family